MVVQFEGYSAGSECAREVGQATEQSAKRERQLCQIQYVCTSKQCVAVSL